jgi:4-hydroxy-3-methylbut-2-enyl diphosphate reductase
VRRAQERARELAEAGCALVIVWERDHPEVQAIVANIRGAIVMDEQQLPGEVRSLRKIGVIAQTTQAPESFRRVIHRLIELPFEELRAFNTICTATVDRQEAALELARQVEVMFVLGGRNSANTARLAQICGGTGVPTHHLETVDELTDEMTRGRNVAGVTAGASTPDWIIDEFVRHLERL